MLEAIAAGHWWTDRSAAALAGGGGSGVLERLLRAVPEALEWHDKETGLSPALLAAVPSSPQQQQVVVVPTSVGESSSATTTMDPYNLLTNKQRELALPKKNVEGSILLTLLLLSSFDLNTHKFSRYQQKQTDCLFHLVGLFGQSILVRRGH